MDQRLVNAPISTAAESRRSDESSLLARRALAVREWRTNNSSRRMAATQSPKPTYWSKDGTKSEPFRELGGTLMAVCASNALGPFNAASSARAWVEGWYTTGCASTSNTGVCWLKTGCQKVSNRAGLLRHNNLGARTAAASNGTAAAASHRRPVCASNALGPFNAASSARAWVEGWYTTGCASTSNTGVCWLKTGCQKVSNRAGLFDTF